MPTHRIDYGNANITFLDVGEGLAIVVETHSHVLVFDTGAKFSAELNAGDMVLKPFLFSRNYSAIDKVIVSHPDTDHSGGLKALQRHFIIKSLVSSNTKKYPTASLCLAGQHWQWEGVNFEFLYPRPQDLGKDNNSSCVLAISAQGHRALLTGDIEKSTETKLLARKTQLQADIIQIPHHGSKSSSSLAFLMAVRPGFAVVSRGKNNRFHFPAKMVVKRYHALGVNWFDTAKHGAIQVDLASLTFKKHRVESRSWWTDYH